MGSSATGTKAKDHSPEIRLNAFHVKPSTSDVISILELRMRSWKIEGLQTPGKQLRNSNRTRCVRHANGNQPVCSWSLVPKLCIRYGIMISMKYNSTVPIPLLPLERFWTLLLFKDL